MEVYILETVCYNDGEIDLETSAVAVCESFDVAKQQLISEASEIIDDPESIERQLKIAKDRCIGDDDFFAGELLTDENYPHNWLDFTISKNKVMTQKDVGEFATINK